MRRTELKRKTELRRGTSRLARVAKRKLPAFRKAAKWRLAFLEAHPECEAHLGWRAITLNDSFDVMVVAKWTQRRPCGFYSVDVHEIVKRGRGGSTTDEGNCVAVCRNCHDFTECYPRIAGRLGLLRSNEKWRNGGER